VEVSLDIHAHPELNYEEQHAAALLSGTLEKHGFQVERGVGGVETAFTATLPGGGGDGPTVAILAEYDALPDIGHGCGHNLIAMAAIGAGLGLQANLDKLPGKIMVIGTPAEEGGGGKIRMLDGGVFKGVDAVLSSHPSSNRTVIPTDIPLGESWSLAMVGYRYIFHGKAAHAAAVPHEGINALNGVIHLFSGIDSLRQHLREDTRIHGVITDGGRAPNVVPEYAAANFMLRCRDRDYLSDVIVGRVLAVAEGAAAMTGCRLEVQDYYPFYENVRPNAVIADLLLNNAGMSGLKLDEPFSGRQGSAASTDFGNVSQALPSYELRYAVSEQPVASHSREMTETATTGYALDAAINVAKTMTLTACDLLLDPSLLAAAKSDFDKRGQA
jgi:amidohydrolase